LPEVYVDVWGPIFLLILFASIVWVFIDAIRNGLSIFWSIGYFLLWLIVFPIYIVRRTRKVGADATTTAMWVLFVCGLFAIGMSCALPFVVQ